MDVDKLASLAQTSKATTSRHIVRSAMPPIMLVRLLSPCCFAAAYGLRDEIFLSRTLGIVGVLPIVVACAMFVYFGLFKTEQLMSEDFQIRQELLQIISNKSGNIKVEPISIEMFKKPGGESGETTK